MSERMMMITMQPSLMIFKSVFLGVLDYGSIFVSSLPEHTKEDIQILQNNALCSCLNIIDPRNVNILEMHADTNVQLFRHRMIRTLLLCIRNAVEEGTLCISNTEVRAPFHKDLRLLYHEKHVP